MPEAIVAEKLTKRYRLRRHSGRTLKELLLGQYVPVDTLLALNDVSFRVGSGETFGVIGANGSGKSTLLKLIAGTSRPTSGRLHVSGRVSALLELGVGFHPDFTGRENAYLTGSILGISRKDMDRQLLPIQEFAEIGEFFDRPVKWYSSGMYTRLAFAVAVHVDPDVLLIDEVLAVGDEYFQHRCFAKINEFRARQKTIVFVSHDLGSVERICDRALLLDFGVAVAQGEVRHVTDRYRQLVREHESKALAGATMASEQRWGSRKVELHRVRILDSSGSESHVVESGGRATFELHYRAHERAESVAFGILFHRDDGLPVYGSNTAIDRVPSPVLDPGDGVVRFRVPHLELLEGQYDVDAAATAEDNSEIYDYRVKTIRFRVYGGARSVGRGLPEVGVSRIAHEWELAPSSEP